MNILPTINPISVNINDIDKCLNISENGFTISPPLFLLYYTILKFKNIEYLFIVILLNINLRYLIISIKYKIQYFVIFFKFITIIK